MNFMPLRTERIGFIDRIVGRQRHIVVMGENQVDIPVLSDRLYALFCHFGFPIPGDRMHRIAFTRFGKESLVSFHRG